MAYDAKIGDNVLKPATHIYNDKGVKMGLPSTMISKPKYISLKKKKRNLY
jgi:hypothetical protein